MAGVTKNTPLWLLLAFVVLPATPVKGACLIDTCCCYSGGYNDTLRAKIAAFTNPPTPPQYEYLGVRPKAGDVYESCFCSDVTRVKTKLTLTDTAYVTKAQDSTQIPTLNTDVTTKLDDLMLSMKNSESVLQPTLISFTAVYASHTATEVVFDVEVLLRGRDETLKTKVSTALATALSQNTLGPVSTASMPYSVASCPGTPPIALVNGQREWTTGSLASSEAVYTCDDLYSLSSGVSEAKSRCDHSQLKWSPLPSTLMCKPDTAECDDNPPSAPPKTTSNWNNYTKDDMTVVSYYCIDAYSSKNNIKAESICRSGNWTSIAATFECLLTGCLDPPPQVPSQGILTWNKRRSDGTKATYTCNEGYKSNTGEDPKVTCTNLTWSGYPDNWACVDEKAKLNLGGAEDDEDEDDINYFLIVTIPSVVGLILLIVFCLCCTRTDSPLFNICNARGPSKSGYTSA